jgi:CRP-like cAMP-binding protein
LRTERRRSLIACPLFQDLAEDGAALADLSEACEPHSAQAGGVLIEEGSEGDVVFVIESGRVRVVKRTIYADDYTVTVLDAEQSAFFGDLALLDQEKRSASVVAETDCTFLSISRERFLAWGDRHPQAGLKVTRRIAEHLARRLRRANQDIATLYSALVDELEQRL